MGGEQEEGSPLLSMLLFSSVVLSSFTVVRAHSFHCHMDKHFCEMPTLVQ